MMNEEPTVATQPEGVLAVVEQELAQLRARTEELHAEVERLRTANATTSKANASVAEQGEVAEGAAPPAPRPILGGTTNTFPTTDLDSADFNTLGLDNNSARTDSIAFSVNCHQGNAILGIADNFGYGVQAFSRAGTTLIVSSVSGATIHANTNFPASANLLTNDSKTNNSSALTLRSSGGLGLVVGGGQAPLFIESSNRVGPPASGSHNAGEVILDGNFDLYLCKKGGAPGAWRRIVTQ
jgi:hypothetical protein